MPQLKIKPAAKCDRAPCFRRPCKAIQRDPVGRSPWIAADASSALLTMETDDPYFAFSSASTA